MKTVKHHLAWVLLLPLFSFLFPLQHGGGPFNTNQFKLLFVWVLTLLPIVLFYFTRQNYSAPTFLKYSFVVVFAFLMLILGHGQGLELSDWIPIGLGGLFAVGVFTNWNAFSSFDSTEWDKFINSLGAVITFAASLMVVFTLPGNGYLNIVNAQLIAGMEFPLIDGGINQPNDFASFLTMCFAFSLWARLRNKDQVVVTSEFVLWALIIGAVCSSGSRVGLLSVIGVVLLWLVNLILQKRNSEAVKIVLVLFVGWFVGLIIDQIGTMDSQIATDTALDGLVSMVSANDTSVAARLGMLKAAWLIGLDSPLFGHGFGLYQYLLPQAFVENELVALGFLYQGATLHPHNELAQIWVVGGLFGILFVGLPAVFLILSSCGSVSRNSWVSLVMFLPLALHLMTEFPLYRSVAHWFLLALFVSVVGKTYSVDNVWTFNRKSVGVYFAPLVSSLFLIIGAAGVAMNGMLVGKDILANAQRIDGTQNVSAYVVERSDDNELSHWAYGEIQGHIWTRAVFQLAMKEGNGQLVFEMLPKMKETMRFFNNKTHWSLYAGALAGLGKKAELIGFIDYIEKLDPKYARGMRQAYGL